MSSPIVNIIPNCWQRSIVYLHQKIAHLNRVQKLAAIIGGQIQNLFPQHKTQIHGLDVGCGDMRMVEMISASNPSICWTCTDIHDLPDKLRGSKKWEKYIQFDGTRLPFADNSFDIVVFSDVLHHCRPEACNLLREAKRVGKYIIVKDHFENGIISRNILKIMDWFGNYGYGVTIPRRYFTKKDFNCLLDESQLRVVHLEDRLKIYPFFASLVLRSDFQFLAILA